MKSAAQRSGPPLARQLAWRLVLIATVVFVVNSIVVGVDYGTDRRTLETELVIDQVEALEQALVGATLPQDAGARALYARHPDAYAFAIVDRSGVVLDAMNLDLIPPSAIDIFADDWITRLDQPEARLLVAGHEFEGRSDGLRMVFVMRADPARRLWWAYLDMFYEHVWIPILPLVLLLVLSSTFLIRRGLAPVSAAAAWARALRPGVPTPPPDACFPAEVADLVDATQRSVERLALAFRAEERRTAEAAHALRTPVAVLLARVDALPDGAATERLRADVLALSRTVQQVLASSRADALVRTGTLDLRGAVEAVIAALAPFAHEKGIALELEAPDIPVLASADAEAVDLALTNLIENAILHGGAGPVRISVEPGSVVRVRDRGPGLPEDAASHIFDPFWRGPGAVPGGAGLGLAIVQRAQQAQGGTVEARNAPGGGAEFVLRWPAANS